MGLAVDSVGGEVRDYAATTREAQAASERAGDVIVRIDGRTVSGGNAGFKRSVHEILQPEGTRFTVSLQSSDGDIRLPLPSRARSG